MSTADSQVIITAKNILHDVDTLKKSREYNRYVTLHLTDKRDEQLDIILEAATTMEQYIVAKALYLAFTDLLNRLDRDEKINSKINSKIIAEAGLKAAAQQ